MRRDDKRISDIAERVFAAQAEDGGFLHGGFDHTKSWHTRPYMCISHIMTYALARFGYLDDPGYNMHMISLQRGSDWMVDGILTSSISQAMNAKKSQVAHLEP